MLVLFVREAAIHWTNIYPVDSEVGFVNNFPFLFSSFFPFNPIELTASHRIDCIS